MTQTKSTPAPALQQWSTGVQTGLAAYKKARRAAGKPVPEMAHKDQMMKEIAAALAKSAS